MNNTPAKRLITLKCPSHTVTTLDPWSQVAIMLISALSFIAAFAWNGTIVAFLDAKFGTNRNFKIHLLYAVLVTAIAGLVIFFIVRYTNVWISKQKAQQEEESIIEGMSSSGSSKSSPTFKTHIRPLFRDHDIDSMMSFGLNLGDYTDVKNNANVIYDRVKEGSMPCDGAWNDEKIALFKKWIGSGMKE
uniref:Uncharacterized protein n=1 Tax=Marseillevirus LCMAC102 TaxID=2506603 RepID=A0A481YUA7_9VIRU|nr:MAG: hypothetical protein LCMAC102_02660 [Marseillevirus LCMAC102]